MEQEQQRGLTHAAADALTAFAIFLVGVVMMIDNHRIGAGWAPDGPESGYFPFRIGVILCIASVVVLLRSLFGKERKREIFVHRKKFKLVLLVLLPTLLYVLAIEFIGIYVASTLFIGAFMRVMDKIQLGENPGYQLRHQPGAVLAVRNAVSGAAAEGAAGSPFRVLKLHDRRIAKWMNLVHCFTGSRSC